MYNTSLSQHKLTIGEHYQRTIVILPLSLPPLFPSSRAAQLRTVAVWIPATSYLLRTPARDINHSSLHTLHLHSQHYIPIYWLVVDNT